MDTTTQVNETYNLYFLRQHLLFIPIYNITLRKICSEMRREDIWQKQFIYLIVCEEFSHYYDNKTFPNHVVKKFMQELGYSKFFVESITGRLRARGYIQRIHENRKLLKDMWYITDKGYEILQGYEKLLHQAIDTTFNRIVKIRNGEHN